MPRKPSLAAKVRRYLRIQRTISLLYKQSDELEADILPALLACRTPLLKLNRSGRAARLKDNYDGKNKVYRAHGIKRFEIEEVSDA